jgi:hypothetical protein
MTDDPIDRWFDAAPVATCAAHGRGAHSLCSRCGTYQCDDCLSPHHRSLCQPCAVIAAAGALPEASRRAAWKLVMLPVIGFGCLLSLAARGSGLSHLPADRLAFLGLWLVPFTCGIWLMRRPAASLAFVGSLFSLALVAITLGPPLVDDFTGQRVLDVVLLSAAPLAAIVDAFSLDRARRHRVLLEALATA